MGRVTPLDTSPSLDEDIRALMEDIDASMADFEQRLEAERLRQPRPAAAPTVPPPAPAIPKPRIAQPPAPPAPTATPAPPTTPREPVAGGLLAELEIAAKEKAGDRDARQAANSQALHEALDRARRYLDAFCRHVNVLAPSISRTYRFNDRCIFENLQWRDANVKSRRVGLAEYALLDFIAFRVRLAAPAPISVTVPWNKLDDLKKEMHVVDLRTAEGMDLDGIVDKDQRIVRLAPDFPVQITLAANYESGRVDILSRNLERFGISAFVCAPEDVTQDFLDELGRYLLSRSDSLPAKLQRAHCRAEL